MKSAERLASEPVVSLLAVGSTEEDFFCLRSICGGAGWKLHEARGLQQAREQMRQHTIAVVLLQYKMADGDGDWTEFLDAASEPNASPYVIVWSRHVDARLWAEVLNLGGYDVLRAPFRIAEVIEAVNAAIRNWREWGVALQSGRKGPDREALSRPNERSVA